MTVGKPMEAGRKTVDEETNHAGEAKPAGRTLAESEDVVFESIIALPEGAGEGRTKTRTTVTKIKAGKPNPRQFIRVNPDPAYKRRVAVFKDPDPEDEFDAGEYILSGALVNDPELAPEIRYATAVVYVTRRGKPGIWLLYEENGGRGDDWARSRIECAERCQEEWGKVHRSDAEGELYCVTTPIDEFPQPRFPAVPMTRLLKAAFKDRLIESTDHPVIKTFLGRN